MHLQHLIQDERWSVAQGRHQQWPVIIRFRQALREARDQGTLDPGLHQHVLQMKWRYAAQHDGLPDETAREQMRDFEKRLLSILEVDLCAFLSAVITHQNQREWVWYTHNPQQVVSRLTHLTQLREAYPLQLTTSPDPDWCYLYEQILSAVPA